MSMKLCICGSRDYKDLDRVRQYVRDLDKDVLVIVGGCPTGPDAVAEAEARACGLDVTVFEAKWAAYGKKAGPFRNREMVRAADRLVAFWDGKSKGTENAIHLARAMNKPVVIFGYAVDHVEIRSQPKLFTEDES